VPQPILRFFSEAFAFLQLCPIYQDIFYVFSVSHYQGHLSIILVTGVVAMLCKATDIDGFSKGLV
jgi:hypothetical protein